MGGRESAGTSEVVIIVLNIANFIESFVYLNYSLAA